ncbi:hypothetical protein, partial [Pseudomonas aeruginosa]
MRKLLIIFSICLAGCQTTHDKPNLANNKHPNTHTKNSVYDRYKYKTNRYTIQQDAAPKQAKQVSFKEPVPT